MLRFLILVIALFGYPLHAYSWNGIGHRAIAIIAESHLTPRAQAEIERLLSREGKSHLSEIAMWADAVRKIKFPPQPSHAVRLPLDHSPFDPKLHCKRNMCAAGAIAASTEVLADEGASPDAKVLALKYVVHLVGDIHQPLHASREGAKIFVNGKSATLHRIWDTDIIRSSKLNAPAVANLIEAIDRRTLDYGNPVIWATESRDISRDLIFPSLPDDKILDGDYMARNWPIVVRRLHEAGWRLSELLNRSLDAPNATSR